MSIKSRLMICAISGSMLVASILGGCNIISKHNPEGVVPEMVLSYAENQTSDYPTTKGGKLFAKLVSERTDGRIQVRIYANAELGDESSATEQVSFGGIDIQRVSLSTLENYSDMCTVVMMPYIYRDSDHMWKVLEGDIGQKVMDSFAGTGLVPLSWYDAGARDFYTTEKPIEKLEDLRGLVIRVQESDMAQDMIRLLGAIPQPSTYDEVYSQLQKGIVDGAENNVSSYETMKHYEISRYFTKDDHMRIPEMQVISQSTWDRLSEEDQKIVKQAALESSLYERELWQEQEKTAEKIVTDAGCEIITLSDEEKDRFREKMEPLYAEYCSKYTDMIEEIEKTE